jgi:SlyX protein
MHDFGRLSQRHPAAQLTAKGYLPNQDYMSATEETLAHLTRMVDDLSEVVARQEGEIAMLSRRVQLLLQREAERESDTGGQVTLGNERPPHW